MVRVVVRVVSKEPTKRCFGNLDSEERHLARIVKPAKTKEENKEEQRIEHRTV